MLRYFNKPNSVSLIQSDESMDLNTKKNLFLLCNEHASRFTVSGELDRAQILLEKA